MYASSDTLAGIAGGNGGGGSFKGAHAHVHAPAHPSSRCPLDRVAAVGARARAHACAFRAHLACAPSEGVTVVGGRYGIDSRRTGSAPTLVAAMATKQSTTTN